MIRKSNNLAFMHGTKYIYTQEEVGGREGGREGGGGEREREREREGVGGGGESMCVCFFVVDDTLLVFLRRMRLMCSSFKTFHLCLLILHRCQESWLITLKNPKLSPDTSKWVDCMKMFVLAFFIPCLWLLRVARIFRFLLLKKMFILFCFKPLVDFCQLQHIDFLDCFVSSFSELLPTWQEMISVESGTSSLLQF